MLSKRTRYLDDRKYKSWDIKRLLQQIDYNLGDLNLYILSTDEHNRKLKSVQEMFFEIALRLD